MTTFTTEDREKAQKLVNEAPYHPGYEDAVVIKPTYQEEEPLSEQITELFKFRDRHLNTSKKIVEFMKDGQRWGR
jgi:hypothetical protein